MEVADFARFLLAQQDEERWEQIIDSPAARPRLDAFLKEYGDRVAFIYKDFPLSEIHPWANHAAVNANCLAAQSNDAYWDFADYIHANRDVVNSEKGRDNQFGALDKITLNEAGKFKLDSGKLQECVKAQNENEVKVSTKEGESLGVSGTPTMFINGRSSGAV